MYVCNSCVDIWKFKYGVNIKFACWLMMQMDVNKVDMLWSYVCLEENKCGLIIAVLLTHMRSQDNQL